MRYSRLFLGLAIVLAALWVIVGEQITGVSSDAVVNARLSTVRTPIAGTVEMRLRPFGTLFAKGETLASVSDPLVDTIRLNDLELEKAIILTEIEQVQRDFAVTTDEIEQLANRTGDYTALRIAEVAIKLERAEERIRLLASKGKKSSISTVNAAVVTNDKPAFVPATSVVLSLALQELETLSVTQDAIVKGIYLGDGYNDATATELKLLDRKSEHDNLASRLTALQSRLVAMDARIVRERKRTEQLSAAVLSAPIDGVLWEVLASDGETIQRGQDVLRLMNCDSALVTLSVPDVVYNQLRVGQTAKFRLNGTDELFDGTITRIAGAGAETIYQNLAIAPSLKHLERYDVALLVPALRENTHLRCTVGQTGRVFFDTRPLDWFRSWLN